MNKRRREALLKRLKPKVIHILPALILSGIGIMSLFLFSKCDTARSECEGNIVVQNPIPDTTLYAGGDSLMIDLVGSPPVFVQTANKQMVFNARFTGLEGQLVVFPTIKLNPNTGDVSILKVVPYNTGKAIVYVTAKDGCIDYWEGLSFNVTVIDTTKH